MNVAIIPARGGSKRIPRKNLIDFAGKPIIAHSIEKALNSAVFDRVIVSTDDAEIAAVAREFGAECPFIRPVELADDYAGTTAVINHAARWLQDSGDDAKLLCCIYPTAPLIQVSDILAGMDLIKSGSWKYVFSATAFGFPVFRGFIERDDHGIKMLHPEHEKTRSQDLPEALHDAGQFYWGTAQAWLDMASIFASWSTFVRLPVWRVQDIDTFEDLSRARLIYEAILEGRHE